ncbi:MAG: hypothetical protein FWG16_04410 [Micrococcales bacterium]|nr:hypothetical protein [Micrococcales bacterium]
MTLSLGLMVLSGLAVSGVYALWQVRDTQTIDPIGTAYIGLDVTRGVVTSTATKANPAVTFSLGSDDAVALVSAETRFVAFQVRASAQGHLGMDYSVAVGTPLAGTVFSGATMDLYKVSEAAHCDGLSHAGKTLVSGPINAIGTDYNQFKSHTQWYCLEIELTTTTLGLYQTEAEVTGTGPTAVGLDDQDQWAVNLAADPAQEPPLGITVTPVVVIPPEL